MRVIHVCAYYAPAYVYGGPVRSIHALCRAQRAYGIDVEVFTTTAAGGGAERLDAAPQGRDFEGIPVRYFDLSPPATLLGASGLAPALNAVLPEADIVHVHGLFNRTVWDAAACLHAAAKPYVLSPRGMLEAAALAHHRWRKRLAWHLKDRATVARASVLHATSSFEADTLRQDYAPRSVVQIPNAVALAPAGIDAGGWRAARGIAADAPIVLSLGRLHRLKRLDLVAASFVELRRRVPTAQLVIAGPDEQHLRPGLERQLAGAQGAVHWIGQVDDETKWALLAAATVLVQCSDSESFGMSVAEALAAGTPVVVTRTCPWREVEDWGCGAWVAQSPAAITDALCAIVSDPDRAREQGRAGRRLVQQRMAPASVAAAWHAVYCDAVRAATAAA